MGPAVVVLVEVTSSPSVLVEEVEVLVTFSSDVEVEVVTGSVISGSVLVEVEVVVVTTSMSVVVEEVAGGTTIVSLTVTVVVVTPLVIVER